MRIEHSERIAAPVASVWTLTLEVESWPELTPTMTSIERVDPGPLAVGSRVRIKQPGQPQRTWTVVELDPGRRFVWSTRAMGLTMIGGHHLEADGDATVVTLTVDLDGAFAGLLGRALARPIRRALATENAGFKAAAEATPEPNAD